MPTVTTRNYRAATPGLARWIAVGAVAGAVSVLIFHQGAAALLHSLGLSERLPYSMQPTQPFGVPQLGSIVFWGAVWGAAFAAILRRLDGWRLVAVSLLLGAVLPTLVAWFVVAPLKGQPQAAGFVPLAMAFGVIVNGAWGLGTGLGLALFGGKRHVERRRATADRRHIERRRINRRRSELQPDAV
jgi:hypothetical protein